MYRKVISVGLVTALCLTAVAGASTVKINFQLRGAAIPPGYFPDYGQAYGPQASGFSYGWSRNIEADSRERNSANAPDQRYDTLIHLQKGADAIWEIEVPNGTFTLHIGAGDASNTDQTNTFDVEGTLVVDPTPATGNFDEYDVTVQVKDGRLTIKPGAGSSNSKIMWVDITSTVFDQMLGKAKNPSPANGEEGLTMPLFTWTPGATAVLHNVYLGTSPELTEADRVGPSLVVAVYYYGTPLIPGGTYYWRVDEVEADGKTVYTGDVWTFSAAAITAFRPGPADAAQWVDPSVELTWKAGKGAVTHDVYLDTDKAAVEEGTSSVSQKGLYFLTWKPPALAPGMTYYWRVDEIAQDGTKTIGAVWSFTTLPVIPITDENLLAWWKMDEGAGTTVVDWSGHGRHLAFAAPAPVWATGHFGSALEFAGTGDSAVYADGTFVNGLDALTITAWVKSDVTNTDKGYIIFADPAGNDNQDMRYDAGGATGGGTNVQKVGVSVAVDATTTTILQLESSNGSQSTDWQHVTIVWQSGQALQFYIDGKLDAPTANSAPVNGTLTSFSKVIIGKGGKDTGGSWDGLIDEIRVYSKALTQEEIQLVMRGDPLLAWNPNPANGSTPDEVGAVPFTWEAGDKAVRHDVYLGTDAAAVAAADTSDATGIYRGRQSGTSFTPSPALEWGQKYFWRIDEVNGDDSISPGFVWSFTLADYLIVDEFESYDDAEGTGTRIYETWIDGYTDGLSGSTVGNLDPPFAEQTIVHGGGQSMPLDYNNINSPYFSEAYREFAPLRNWNVGGVTDLSLWVRGTRAPVAAVTEIGGKMTVSGAGTDIWNSSDQFTFVYKSLNSDGSLIARVTNIGAGTNTWAKGGVMVRDSLEAGSTHAMMILSANTDGAAANGYSFQYRLTADQAAASTGGTAPAIAPPYYVKIERKGDTLSGWVSPDNNNWTQVGTAQYIAMSPPVYIGICVSSHTAGEYRTFEFDNVKATGASGSWQTKEIGLTRNSQQPLYVIVEDSTGKQATVVDPNVAAVNSTTWTEWKIPLTDLKGVNLSKVKAVYIGVGNKANPAPDGTGRVYIDDIRVIKP